MKKYSSSRISELDEYPEITQADLDHAVLRVGLKPVPRKKRVNIMLDAGIVAYFKTKAGGRGYQTLINETLKRAASWETIEMLLRRVVRDELRRKKIA